MVSPRRPTSGTTILDLRAGCARWLRFSHAAVSLLGLAGILGSDARPAWTAAAVVALVLVHCATARRMSDARSSGRLRLFADGTAVLLTSGGAVAALQRSGGWLSRWFCIVPLQRLTDGRRVDAIVCRSRNSADAYRRLLVWLRMRENGAPVRAPARGLTWS
ncbi:MAG: hypothetical protein EHM68_05090 [Lysobacterales bacterium]|nr:MAG: hypothetical protein EHM68_05090 [Xanthomonadales bacterium]